MHSANENEDQLLRSDNENGLQQHESADSRAREHQDRHRRVRRMNRQERDNRERARDRRRHHRHDRPPRHNHASSEHSAHLHNRNGREVNREYVRRQQDEHHSLKRSK